MTCELLHSCVYVCVCGLLCCRGHCGWELLWDSWSHLLPGRVSVYVVTVAMNLLNTECY